jgi:hypothetical protein
MKRMVHGIAFSRSRSFNCNNSLCGGDIEQNKKWLMAQYIFEKIISVVGIRSRLQAERPRTPVPQKQDISLQSKLFRPTHIFSHKHYRCSRPRVKRPGRDVDCLSLNSAKVKSK